MKSSRAALVERQNRFQSHLDTHRGILIRVVSTYAHRPEDQQDLAQDIMLQLWRAYERYDPRRQFSTWMYQVALNTAISWFRKHHLRTRHHAEPERLEDIAQSASISIESHALSLMIQSLSELDRALLILYMEDHSASEIGEVLGLSPSNVATKINRLKQQLRLQAQDNL
jgi:RNA polymerase sigma-70 factor, ECF subfamily